MMIRTVEAHEVKIGDEIDGLSKVKEIKAGGSYITFLTERRGNVRYTKRQLVTLIVSDLAALSDAELEEERVRRTNAFCDATDLQLRLTKVALDEVKAEVERRKP